MVGKPRARSHPQALADRGGANPTSAGPAARAAAPPVAVPPAQRSATQRSALRDIEVVPPAGEVPLSRGAPERRLQRVDRYDRRAVVTNHETLTPTGTVRLSFRVVDDRPFAFVPGYFIGIKADCGDYGMRKSPYCLVSAPNDDATFQLLVRLVPEGPLSYYLGGLEVGDVIGFRGPSGRSMVPKEDGTGLVLLATGVGIGPFLGLVRHLADSGFERPMQLYWGLRLVEDICLLDELDDLARRCPGFGYRLTLSRPAPQWDGLRGRLTESVPDLLSTLGNKRYLLVGNGCMTQELAAVLSDLGVDERLIHQEVYFNVKHRPEAETLAEIRSRFVASDLFSPFLHREAGLYMPQSPISRLAPDRGRVSGSGRRP